MEVGAYDGAHHNRQVQLSDICHTVLVARLRLDVGTRSLHRRSALVETRYYYIGYACCCLLQSSEPFHLMPNFGVTQWRN